MKKITLLFIFVLMFTSCEKTSVPPEDIALETNEVPNPENSTDSTDENSTDEITEEIKTAPDSAQEEVTEAPSGTDNDTSAGSNDEAVTETTDVQAEVDEASSEETSEATEEASESAPEVEEVIEEVIEEEKQEEVSTTTPESDIPKLIDSDGNGLVEFTKKQLLYYNGLDDKPVYFAYKNLVYDASHIQDWGGGVHYGNYAGYDLTDDLAYATHGEEKLKKAVVVGELIK